MDIIEQIKDILREQEEERIAAEKAEEAKKKAEIDELIKKVVRKRPETPFEKIRKRHDG
jgi:hypothetical protein